MDPAERASKVGREKTPRNDQDLLAAVRHALGSEIVLGGYAITRDGEEVTPRAALLFPEGCWGVIAIDVEDGVIWLRGQVENAEDRHLAGVLAGGVPGCRGLVNELSVAAT